MKSLTQSISYTIQKITQIHHKPKVKSQISKLVEESTQSCDHTLRKHLLLERTQKLRNIKEKNVNWVFNILLNKSEENRYPFLMPNARENYFNISTFSMMLAIGYLRIIFVKLRNLFSIPVFLKFFSNYEWFEYDQKPFFSHLLR